MVDLIGLTVLSLLVRLPAYLANRHLTVDDGVFGASAVAMRAGGRPFAQVFSSQGPLFLPLVWLGDVAGLRTTNAPRLISVVSGVALTVAVYLAGRRISGRAGALLAAGLVSTTASVLWVTAPLAADGPALAFGAAAFVLALAYRDSPTMARALALGAAFGAAVSVKSLLLPVAVPLALVLLQRSRRRPLVAAAGAALALNLAVSLPWGLRDVWEQAYGYHLQAAGDKTPGANLAKVAHTLVDRDLPVTVAFVLALAVAVLALAGARRSRRADAGRPGRRAAAPVPPASTGPAAAGSAATIVAPGGPPPVAVETAPGGAGPEGRGRRLAGVARRLPVSDAALLWAWLAATVFILAAEHPLWRPHVAHLIPPAALLVARYRPPWLALAVAAVVVVPYHVAHSWPLLDPAPYRGSAARAERLLAGLPPGALAISDEPGLVWRAGRLTPPELVDASILRIQAHQITGASLGATAARADVCAVAVWDPHRWGSFRDLPGRLSAAGYRVVFRDPRGQVFYRKADCHPR